MTRNDKREAELAAREKDGAVEMTLQEAIDIARRWAEEDSIKSFRLALARHLQPVPKAEFDSYVAGFPRPLKRYVCHDYKPPLVTLNDPMVAPEWPDTVVAAYRDGDPPSHWQIFPGADTP